MDGKLNAMRALDRAIDLGEMAEIDRCLDALSSLEGASIRAEEPAAFSARILHLEKENRPMKHSKKAIRLAFAAALAAVLGVTVYAAVNLHLLSFSSGTRYVTMRTNQAMTEQEAQALVRDDLRERSDAPDGNSAVLAPQQSFQSVEEAEAAMDMTLILPSAMPEMKMDSIEGQSLYNEAGYQNNTVWIVCSGPGGRMLGVTTTREVVPEGAPLTSYTLHEFDEGSEGSYRSKSGVTFTTLTESDGTGERTAQIATVLLGEYEYSLVFVGFEPQEWQKIVDSADLSPYQN